MIIRYIKFDTFTPAAERGLPVTRVISRMSLQEILARAVGEDIIMNDSNVVSFEDHGDKVIMWYVEVVLFLVFWVSSTWKNCVAQLVTFGILC